MTNKLNIKIKSFLCALLLLATIVLPLASCGGNVKQVETDSNGFIFTLSDDGSYYVLSGCKNKVEELVVPSSYNGLPVKEIGNDAFYQDSDLRSVVIPDSIEAIHHNAFYECKNLANITFPNSIKFIGTNAFYKTAFLIDESNREDGVLYIGNILVAANRNIAGEYTVKEGTSSIASGAFTGCAALTSVVLPESLTYIGTYAFYGCAALEKINFPSKLHTIDAFAFDGCKVLNNITIPASLKKIGHYAFQNCTVLTKATFEVTSGWKRYYNGVFASVIREKNLSNISTAGRYLAITFNDSEWIHK